MMGDLISALLLQMEHVGGMDAGQARRIERAVRHEYGGQWVYIPKRVDPTQQRQDIESALMCGQAPHDIASTMGVSLSTVWRVKRAL